MGFAQRWRRVVVGGRGRRSEPRRSGGGCMFWLAVAGLQPPFWRLEWGGPVRRAALAQWPVSSPTTPHVASTQAPGSPADVLRIAAYLTAMRQTAPCTRDKPKGVSVARNATRRGFDQSTNHNTCLFCNHLAAIKMIIPSLEQAPALERVVIPCGGRYDGPRWRVQEARHPSGSGRACWQDVGATPRRRRRRSRRGPGVCVHGDGDAPGGAQGVPVGQLPQMLQQAVVVVSHASTMAIEHSSHVVARPAEHALR